MLRIKKENVEELRRDLLEMIEKMDDDQLDIFIGGIDQITVEYGWGGGVDDLKPIDKIYKQEY